MIIFLNLAETNIVFLVGIYKREKKIIIYIYINYESI